MKINHFLSTNGRWIPLFYFIVQTASFLPFFFLSRDAYIVSLKAKIPIEDLLSTLPYYLIYCCFISFISS